MTMPSIHPRRHDRRMSEIPEALTSLGQLTTLLRSRRPVVFLDFDGTLSNIVNDPAAATLVDGMKENLARLTRYCTIGVITGRDLADIETRVGMPGIWYAGSHGFEIVGPDGQRYRNDLAVASVPNLERAADILRDRLTGIPGVVLERKRFGLSVHYRNADLDRRTETAAVVQEVGGGTGLRATRGRMVTELRPDVNWDKGRTLDWILDHLVDADNVLPIYIGDDFTDEDAFVILHDRGVGIVVRHFENGDRRSAARFAVDSPVQVRKLVQWLADLLGSGAQTMPPAGDPWTVFFEGYDPNTEKLREALCTLGNGAFATRGCAPRCRARGHPLPGHVRCGRLQPPAGRSIGNHSRQREHRQPAELVAGDIPDRRGPVVRYRYCGGARVPPVRRSSPGNADAPIPGARH